MADWAIGGGLFFLVLVVLLAAGFPIAFALGLIGTIGLFIWGGEQALRIIPAIAFGTVTQFPLAAVPLFIFMAELIVISGISDDLFSFALKWMHEFPGGLAAASIIAAATFAAVCGSSPATAATIGLVAIPQMLKYGYKKELAVGCVAGGGALGILIPPSICMIIYGVITEESVPKLFMAGVIPGIISVVLFVIYIVIHCTINPSIAPKTGEKITWEARLVSLGKVWPVVVLIIGIMGGIYAGVCTPTEAAAVGCAIAFVLVVVYRRFSLEKLKQSLLGTVKTTSFIVFVFVGASVFGYLLTVLQIPQGMSAWLCSLEMSRWVIIGGIQVLWLVLGCFLDPTSIMVLTIPLFMTTVSELGFSLIWFGVVCVINMEIANLTPPLGYNLFIIKGIVPPDVSLGHILRGVIPFILLHLATLVLVMFIPGLSLWLPGTMMPAR